MLSNQILNNAPFDLFLSADTEKPLIIKSKLNKSFSIQIYAIGQLALWIPNASNINCLNQLPTIPALAIANPKTAPYGSLAHKVLTQVVLKNTKIIETSNVSQTYLYTKNNLTQAGFVPYSMLINQSNITDCIQKFNDSTLSQSMILLNENALSLFNFILSTNTQKIIEESGYNVPK